MPKGGHPVLDRLDMTGMQGMIIMPGVIAVLLIIHRIIVLGVFGGLLAHQRSG